MKRVALLGATGSIGTQALEIIDAHPELELVAAASGSQDIAGLAPLTQVGGDLTELLDRAEPDVVLNAIVGFAGMPATFWALEHGIDLALANKESLVAGGELATAAWKEGGGRILPVDSEHSAAFQLLRGARPRPFSPSSLPPPEGLSEGAPASTSRESPRGRRWRTRPGAWARRSLSTRRLS
jgi:1-deoxy-D-xylulose-5-phosphate reductoisomerase